VRGRSAEGPSLLNGDGSARGLPPTAKKSPRALSSLSMPPAWPAPSQARHTGVCRSNMHPTRRCNSGHCQ